MVSRVFPLLDGDGGTRSTNRVTNGADKPEFDETAVLEELERLRGAIRLARTKREEKVAEFETFMRDARMASKREAARAVGVPEEELEIQASAVAPAPIPEVHQATPAPAAWSPPPSSAFRPAEPAPPPTSPLSRLDDMSEANAAFPDTVPRRGAIDKYIIAGGAAVLVVALLLVSWKGGDSGTSGSPAMQAPRTAPQGSSPAGPSTTGQAPQQGGTAATPAAAPLPLQVEIVTVRKVWMRVTVDGDRAIEDEVEQGQRLRFGANKAIVIRAGDAGSVTIAVDGQAAAPLGPAGQTVTRTLVPRAK
jgi:hypothetical protein